jgi:transmembrane sensor
MSENDVSELLEKYFQGNTSLEEEKIIYDYMLRHPMHGHAPWFLDKEKLSVGKSHLTIQAFRERVSGRAPLYQRTSFRVAASLLLVCAVTFLIFFNNYPDTVTVASGNVVKQIRLPDGSAVTLNKNTVARYSSKFKSARDLWLEGGEAFFEVVKNPDVPFIVHAGKTTTRVTGTSFNVRNDSHLTEVAVLSGQVVFGSSKNESAALTLTKGMGGEFNADAGELKEIPAFDNNNIAWKTHRLEFRDTPLESVVETLERYFRVRIETPDSAALTCRFRGVFEEADLNEIVQVMDYSLNVKLTFDGSVYTLSGRGCKP